VNGRLQHASRVIADWIQFYNTPRHADDENLG